MLFSWIWQTTTVLFLLMGVYMLLVFLLSKSRPKITWNFKTIGSCWRRRVQLANSSPRIIFQRTIWLHFMGYWSYYNLVRMLLTPSWGSASKMQDLFSLKHFRKDKKTVKRCSSFFFFFRQEAYNLARILYLIVKIGSYF